MEKICIPEKYREDFKKTLDTAVRLKKFTAKTLADEMGISSLNAAIFIGFMDKYSFIYPSGKSAEKTVCISEEEWENIGRDIDAYTPPVLPEEEPLPEFFLTPFPEFSGQNGKSVEVYQDRISVRSKDVELNIDKDSVTLPEFKKATFFKKGYIDFDLSQSSFARIHFKRGENAKVLALFESIKGDLDKKI